MAGARMLGVTSLLNSVDDITSKWDSKASGRTTANTEYSVFVEYGTSRMSAQPYMRPAAEQVARRVGSMANQADGIDELVRMVCEEIRDVAKTIVPVDTGRLQASIKVEFGGESRSGSVSASF